MNRPRHELFPRAGLAFDQHGRRHGRHLFDLHQHFLDRRRFAEDAGAPLQAPALDEPPHGRRDFGRIGGFHEPIGEAELVGYGLRRLIGRLHQSEGRHAVLVGGREQPPRGRFVQPARQDDRVGGRLFPPHRLAHVVERGDHRRVEPRLLQRGVHANGLLEVVGGEEDAVSHEKRSP